MKIHSIRIDGFGKLGDFSADFSENMNCIRRENEFGKSTILAFIRAMFYGFPRANRGKDVRNFSRGKYSPWTSGGYGGTLTLSYKGRTYRIERRFSGSKSEDRVVLRDERTGIEEDTGGNEIGVYLFGLEEVEFVNTFFVGQLESRLNEDGREAKPVADKLANLATDGSAFYSFEKADKNLKEAVTDLMAARGGGGVIRELETEKEELTRRLREAEEDFLRIEEIVGQMDAKTEAADLLEKGDWKDLFKQKQTQSTAVERLREARAKSETDRILCTERIRVLEESIQKQEEDERREKERRLNRAERIRTLEKDIAEFRQNDAERTADLTRIDQATEARTVDYESRLPELRAVYGAVSEETIRLRAEAERLETEGTRFSGPVIEADAARFRNSLRLPAVIALISLSVAVIGMICAAVFRTPALYFLSIALLPAALPLSYIVILFLRRRATNARLTEERAEFEAVSRQVRQDLSEAILREKDAGVEVDRFTEQFEHDSQMQSARKDNVIDKLEDIRSNRAKARAEIELLFEEEKNEALTEQSKTDARDPAGNPVHPVDSLNEAKERLIGLGDEIAAASKSLEEAQADEARLEADQTRIRSEIDRLRQEASKLAGSAESLAGECADPSEIEEKIRAIEERIARAKEYHQTLLLATEAMAEASKEMESRFAPKVNEIAGRYLSRLTGNRYCALRFDRGFKVQIADRRDGIYYEADYFSAGTVDQVYLALRLAIADLIDDSEDKLPILLDDALVQYDDERAERAVSLLRELSTERQIIMFTCHKSVEAHFDQAPPPVPAKRKTRKSIDG